MAIDRLGHYNIRTTRLEETIAFYVDGLGMTLGNRPPVDPPGAWICASDGHACIHIDQVDTPPGMGTGSALDHLGFEASAFDVIAHRLTAAGISFDTVDLRPNWPIRRIYAIDPNGIKVEVTVRGMAGDGA
jgi:catechol 2,3-dioxygenase-like lactoylglutathione lyase family enzyme